MTCIYLVGNKERGLLKYGISTAFDARLKTHRMDFGLVHVIRRIDRADAGFIEWCMHQLTRHLRVRQREYLIHRPRVVSRLMDSLCLLSDAEDIWPLIRLGGAMPAVVLERCETCDAAVPADLPEAKLVGARGVVVKAAADAGWNLRKIFAHPDMDGWTQTEAYRKLLPRGTAVRRKR